MRATLAIAALAAVATLTSACTHHYKIPAGRDLPDDHTDHVRGALEGAGVGLLAGAATGAVVGFASGDDEPCGAQDFFCLSFTAREKAVGLGLYGAGIGAVGGLVLGGLIGSRTAYEHEDSVVPRVSAVLAPGQASATASWRF